MHKRLSSSQGYHARKVIIATDCITAVKHLRETYMGPNKMILSDINSMLGDFDEAKVVHA